ncbi:MAG TPA: HupE/UreJ family protein [Sulfurivirga caldicuralii]|nr:HupE/UreJ family protein [Sulfurivirga caldicuralii]
MKKVLLVAATMAVPTVALAHPGHDGGLVGGLLHPLTGWDHLLAMLAIGMLAVQMKGRSQWALPLAFITALVAGGMLGLMGMGLGPVELIIAASLVVLGSLLVSQKRLPLQVGVVLAVFFGLYHGVAHGLEAGTAPGAFMLGMLLASAMLHGAGILMMRLGQQVWAGHLARIAGAGMAVAGGALLLG